MALRLRMGKSVVQSLRGRIVGMEFRLVFKRIIHFIYLEEVLVHQVEVSSKIGLKKLIQEIRFIQLFCYRQFLS